MEAPIIFAYTRVMILAFMISFIGFDKIILPIATLFFAPELTNVIGIAMEYLKIYRPVGKMLVYSSLHFGKSFRIHLRLRAYPEFGSSDYKMALHRAKVRVAVLESLLVFKEKASHDLWNDRIVIRNSHVIHPGRIRFMGFRRKKIMHSFYAFCKLLFSYSFTWCGLWVIGRRSEKVDLDLCSLVRRQRRIWHASINDLNYSNIQLEINSALERLERLNAEAAGTGKKETMGRATRFEAPSLR